MWQPGRVGCRIVLANLTTERLVLRPWTHDDVDTVFRMYSLWEVVRYLGSTPKPMSERADATAAIARWSAYGGPLHGVWAIVPADGGEPVGTALLKPLALSDSGGPAPETEVGWHLHPDAWGRGYATEAGRRLLEHAWESGLEEVFAVTYPENTASQAVCRRIGMTHLGATDRYYDVTCALFRADRPGRH